MGGEDFVAGGDDGLDGAVSLAELGELTEVRLLPYDDVFAMGGAEDEFAANGET